MQRIDELVRRAGLLLGGAGNQAASRSVVRGAGGAFAVQGAGMVVSAVANLVMARLAGAEGYGVYAWLLSWAVMLALLANLGTETLVIRLGPKYEHEGDWGRLRGLSRWTHSIGIVCGLALGVVFVPGIALASEAGAGIVAAAAMTALLIPPTAALMTTQGLLRAFHETVRSFLPAMVLRPAIGLALVCVVWLTSLLQLSGAVLMGLTAVASLLALVVARRWLAGAMPGQVAGAEAVVEAKAWLRISLPMLMRGATKMAIGQVDVILVGIFVGTKEAGLYAIASRLAQFVMMGNLSASAIAAPLIARAWARNEKREARHVASVAARLATAFALVAGGALLLVDEYVLAWAGQDPAQGSVVIQLLIVGSIVSALAGPVAQMLDMTGHERANATISTTVLVIFLAAGVPVIQTWGVVGAAALRAGVVALRNVWTWAVVRGESGVYGGER